MSLLHRSNEGRNLLRVALAAALLCGSLPWPSLGIAGEAVDAADEKSAEQKMLELNEAGFSAFAEGEFSEAARKFEEAHAYVADPILRKNAAIAWFKANRCEKASEAAVFFLLADEMTVKDRVEARSVLGHCRLEEAEVAIESGEPNRARAIVERVAFLHTDDRVDRRLTALRMQLGDSLVSEASVENFEPREVAGWSLVATGAAIIAGNIGYHVVSDRSDDTSDWLVPALYGVGGVTSVAGVWMLASPSSADTPAQEAAKPAAQKAPAPSVQVGMTFKF